TAMAALAAAAMGAAFAAPARAQDDAAAEEPVERAFSTAIGELANEALELRDTNPAGALEVINRALSRDVTPYEQYQLLNLRADVSYELDNVPQAIADWQQMLTLGIATPEETAGLNA